MYKRVRNTDNYYITSTGRVYKKWLKSGFKELKGCTTPKAYRKVGITYKDKHKGKFIHRLVAEAFIGEVKSGYNVNHIDGNKCNNNLENLEIVTELENIRHSFHVLNKGVRGVLKLDPETLEVIESYPSLTEAERTSNVTSVAIGKVCFGERRLAGGFTWCYKEDYHEEHLKELKDWLNDNRNRRAVEQIDKKSGEIVGTFDSIKEAKERTGITTVAHVLTGRTKTGGGYYWRYIGG